MASSMLRRSIFRNLICGRPALRRRISSSSEVERAHGVPWLLIEDSVEDGVLYNNFYSMADKKVIKKEAKYTKSSTKDIGMVVGSSHGWLALCNLCNSGGGSSSSFNNNNTYLYNPVSQSIFDLPSFPISVPSKAALLLPLSQQRVDEDFVYSMGQKLLFCTNNSDCNFECWDLEDLANPKRIWKIGCNERDERFPREWKYLVFAEQSERLFLVRRRLMEDISSTYYGVQEVVVKLDAAVDKDKVDLHFMENTLDAMAFFIGSTGHSFALEPDEMDENIVEPNSIYFTDTKELTPPPWDHDKPYGGHNYEENNFSPFYYSLDFRNFRRIKPTPTWFSPSH